MKAPGCARDPDDSPVGFAAAATAACRLLLSPPPSPSPVPQHIRDITDPEHPYTLEQLSVVSEEAIEVDDAAGTVQVQFTPTVEHCSMATLIGLCIRVKLLRALPPRFKVGSSGLPAAGAARGWVGLQAQRYMRAQAGRLGRRAPMSRQAHTCRRCCPA